MKKIFAILLIMSMLVASMLFLGACGKEDEPEPEPEPVARAAADNLYSDSGYVDYAEVVKFDLETYPELEDQGLFWYTTAGATGTSHLRADTAEGAALVDVTKPTIVFVHGMQANMYGGHVGISVNGYVSEDLQDQMSYYTSEIDLLRLILEAGYNVGVFQYSRFCCDLMPSDIEKNLWSNECDDNGIRARDSSGTVIPNCTEYTVSEHLVGDYLRALKLLPEGFGTEEIRFAAHSMGGEVVAPALFLMTELKKCGQLAERAFPDRYSMLDTYFSVTMKVDNERTFYMGISGVNLRWSGKALVNDNVGHTIIECLKQVAADGVVLDYYTTSGSFLQFGIPAEKLEDLRKCVVYTVVEPKWDDYSGYSYITGNHNAVMEQYFFSLMFDPVVDSDGKDCASAATDTEYLRTLIGNKYVISEGERTVTLYDDVFTLIDTVR